MRLRFPLYAQVVLWFLVNLLLLSVVFYAFLKVQFRLGIDSLLLGQAGERIQAVSEVIVHELRANRGAGWDETLERFSTAYRVQFAIFRDDGTQIAGESLALPREVRGRLQERRLPFQSPPGLDPRRPGVPRDQPQDRPGMRPPERREFRPPGGPPPDFRNEPEMRNEPPLRREASPPGPLPKFMLRTANPTRYWVGVRLPVVEGLGANRRPITLMAVSQSVRGGGLFFDPFPWIVVGSGALLLSVLFWLPLVRGITRSISQMTRATEAIAEGRFEVRIEAGRNDELAALGEEINRMAARLSGFMTGQRRFLGDIAHELCSPLARIQMALGILDQRADAQQRAYVEDVQEEVRQMSELVNELLSFSKAGIKPRELQLVPVNLRELAGRVVDRESANPAAVQNEIPADLSVAADPELLGRALANLVRNSLRYAGDSGPITLAATAENGHVKLTVADHGPGLPEELREHLFEPFYRKEFARDRDTGGAGLGLAIVKSCVEACQGTVQVRNRSPHGLEFEIQLKAGA